MSHYTWTFDVRNTVKDYPTPPTPGGYEGDNASAEAFYDHVNAMCFLLNDIPYRVVYGAAHDFAVAMLDKFKHCDPRTLRRVLGIGMPEKLVEKFELIRDAADSATIEMRVYYQKVFPDDRSNERTLYLHFEDLHEFAVANNRPLCMPFVHIQNGDSAPIPEDEMQKHIDAIGNYTLFDIYTKSAKRFPELGSAVSQGKTIGALGGDGAILGSRTWGPGNNRKCKADGSGCTLNNGTWCNIDSSGNCTTGNL